MSETPLRQAKRDATAAALAVAAFELTVERGLDGFHMDELVQRAGYSRRTFGNYYSCKEEAVAAIATEGIGDVLDRFEASDFVGTTLDLLEGVVRSQLSSEVLERLLLLESLARQYPTLEPHVLAANAKLMERGLEVVLRHSDGNDELFARLLITACYGTLTLLIRGGVSIRDANDRAEEGSFTLVEFVDEVFRYLRTGFSKPL